MHTLLRVALFGYVLLLDVMVIDILLPMCLSFLAGSVGEHVLFVCVCVCEVLLLACFDAHACACGC
jgi:hypothetical protein